MRILHTGDLHLDSAFSSFGAKDAQKYRELGRTLLRNIFECAECEKCQMILIAGDLFDSENTATRTVDTVLGIIENAQGVSFFYLPVNHEKDSWGEAVAVAFEKLRLGEYASYGEEKKRQFLQNLGG